MKTVYRYSKKDGSQSSVDLIVARGPSGRKGGSSSVKSAPPQRRNSSSSSHSTTPLPTAALQSSTKARRIRLYRNGDTFYDGLLVVLAPNKFHTFDALLAYINKTPLADPSILRRGVRYIFTVTGKQISSLDDLHDGCGYVCASTAVFRQLDYEKIQSPQWVKQFKASIRGLGEIDSEEDVIVSRDFVVPRMIFVFRAGPRPRNRVKMLLNRRTARSFEQVLTDVADVVHETGPVKQIFTLAGKQLSTLKDFFGEDNIFVSFGLEKFSEAQLQLNEDEKKFVNISITRHTSTTTLKTNSNRRVSRSASTCAQIADVVSPQTVDTLHRMCDQQRTEGTVEASTESDIEVPGGLMSKYRFGKVLFKDGPVTVRKCDPKAAKASTQTQLVLKITEKTELVASQTALITAEATILRQLSHQNLLELTDEFESPTKLCQVFELSSALDVLDFIYGLTRYTEKDASQLMLQLVGGLHYLHSLNIAHRNIKPTNILVESLPDGEWNLKLYDFGLATPVSGTLYTMCGTPTYMAPEIIRGIGYGVKADIWAAGVVGYILLCGFPPFVGANNEEIFRNIATGQLCFASPWWDNISNLAKDLIVFMLEEYPQVRSSALEVLDHPWVSRDIAADIDIRPQLADTLPEMIEAKSPPSKPPSLSLITFTALHKSSCHHEPITLPPPVPVDNSITIPTELTTECMQAMDPLLIPTTSSPSYSIPSPLWMKTPGLKRDLNENLESGEGLTRPPSLPATALSTPRSFRGIVHVPRASSTPNSPRVNCDLVGPVVDRPQA